MTIKKFPENIFSIVNPEDFDKNTKKKFSEDYVEENFRAQGWNVYEPFVDKGYDRIITKKINGKTITRFLQIKTRRLEKSKSGKIEYVGYTIRPKDIVTDPRVVFIIFCDNKNVEDLIIFPINEWIAFMEKNNPSLFDSIGFKQGDAKFNDTCFNRKTDSWFWKNGSISLDKFVNEQGLKLIENTQVESNLEKLRDKIINLRKTRIYNLQIKRKLKSLSSDLVETAKSINQFINIKKLKKEEFVELMKKNNKLIKKEPELVQKSIGSYFSKNEKKILEL